MDVYQAIESAMGMSQFVCLEYLRDLTDEEMMRRAHPKINHLKWQIGHLIHSEHKMIDGLLPGSMPPLPENFADQYSRESAVSDEPGDFHSKDELITILKQQRAGTLATLAQMSPEDLDRPAPESLRDYAPTFGDVFSLQGSHWMMHAGQWAVVRRQLGRDPLF